MKAIFYRFITKKITIAKWELNLLLVMAITVGFIFGTYLTLSHFFPKLFALNDTTYKWTFNTASANTYTYDTSLMRITDSGVQPVANLLQNSSFDTNLSNWYVNSPDTIAGLQLWLKADTIPSATKDSEIVTTWPDLSPNANSPTISTEGNKPAYRKNIINGNMPVVRFDGTSSVLKTPNTFTYGSIFSVLNYTENGGTAWTSNDFSTAVAPNFNSAFAIEANGSGTTLLVTGTSYINGTQTTDFSPLTTFKMVSIIGNSAIDNQGGMRIGQHGICGLTSSNCRMWGGDIGEVIVYDTVLSSANQKNIETYLGSRYSITPANVTLTATQDATTKYSGTDSVKLVATADTTYTQSFNVGNTASYTLEAYAYTTGAAVTTADLELFYNNATITTTYTSVGNGWYKLTGNLTGANSSRAYGVKIKSGKTVYVDDIKLFASVNRFNNPTVETDLSNWEALGTPPDQISGGNLKLWLKADGLTGVNDGDSIATWTNSADNTNNPSQSTASKQATYVANAVNGQKPALRFNGTNTDYLFTGISTNPGTVFATVKNNNSADGMIFSGGPSNIQWRLNGAAAYYFLDGTTAVNPTGLVNNVWHIVDTIKAGTTLEPFINGVSKGQSTFGAQTFSYLGSYQDTSNFIRADLAEAIIFNTNLTAAQHSDVELYLTKKYGISTTATSDITATLSAAHAHNGTNAIQLVAPASNAAAYGQMLNVGNTNSYNLVVYAYTDGTAVTSNDLQLFYDGAPLTTTYTADTPSGWYKLSATVTGANYSRGYGVLVKANKTVYIDDMTLYKAGSYTIYTTAAHQDVQVQTWDSLANTLTASGNAAIVYQVCLTDGSTCDYSSANRWQYYTAGAWANAVDDSSTYANTLSQLTQAAMQTLNTTAKKISFKAISKFGGGDTPLLADMTVGYTTDVTPPSTNASAIIMKKNTTGSQLISNDWTNDAAPYFSWTAGADNPGGVGLKGYCLYLGSDSTGDPATTKGLLGTSPVATTGTTCQFITSSLNIDFATISLRGNTWLTSSTSPYYLNIKAIDNGGNLYPTSAQFQFRFDNTPPTNVTYISAPNGSFGNVTDMYFNWPSSGSSTGSDDHVGLLGYQYAINGTDESSWHGSQTDSTTGISFLPPNYTQPRYLTSSDAANVTVGNNTIYFRAVDTLGNVSLSSTYRTASILYGGAAPTFPVSSKVTVDPTESTANSFALSWPQATASSGRTVASYYYMVNLTPPSTLSTMLNNPASYKVTKSLSISAAALSGAQKGTNTVYVVAVDDQNNYSPSTAISGTFTLNSNNPDPPKNVIVSDASIKSASLWRASIAWEIPDYTGTGSLTYIIQRSSDGNTWTTVTTTSGTAYVDTVTESKKYYWRVGTYDTSGASQDSPSYSNAVTLIPKGSYTSPATLSSGPTVTDITPTKAKISWITDRTSDSKVAYSTTSGKYNVEEPSNAKQVTDHTINLINLTAGTTYYYVAKWTDEDGNTGVSTEKSFTTEPRPVIIEPTVKSIGLSTALIQFTSTGASKVKIYYGVTNNFGGFKELATSAVSTQYTTDLSGLQDGTKYFYRINSFDSDGNEYDGDVQSFTTLPRPKISNVKIQQVAGTAQSTILVTWDSNTEISSIVSYAPENNSSASKDQVAIPLIAGEHKMIINGLLPQTNYFLTVKGQDKLGNQAISDSFKITTALDTRPPGITDLKSEGASVPQIATTGQPQTAQLVISWNTDEPASSQVEFGEGTGTSYSQRTLEDSNLTFNHLVVISNLTPSKVYHFRAVSKDKAGNEAHSVDSVSITPRATDNALDLVISSLSQVFGFLKGLF